MAESGSETEIKCVEEALGAGRHLLQKLYSELDKEREASATAASEALSMILRLQGEKAALKMEASQYQRMAEEKIYHAEEYFSAFNDMIYQKEMEIASLEFQVQAYRYKLLSLGCSDLGSSEPRFSDKFLLQNKDIGFNEVRRAKSLPVSQHDERYYRNVAAEMKTFEIPKPDCCPLIVEHPSRCSWEQTGMLDEQIKEISDSKGSSEEIFESLNGGIVVIEPDVLRELKPDVTPKCSSLQCVQDIFEIPEANQNVNLKACQKLQRTLVFEDENRLGKPDSLPIDDPYKMYYKHEKTKAKKAYSCKSQKKNKPSKSRKGKVVAGSCTTPAHQQIDEIVAESRPFQQLCRVLDQLERNSGSTRQEITNAGLEEMRLLKEIQEQLNSIQSEMTSLKINRHQRQHPTPDDSMYILLQEAMLHLWI